MRLCELASVSRWLPDHGTALDPFWQHDIERVTEEKIQLYYARSGLLGLRTEAVKAIDALQAAVILGSFDGVLTEPPMAIVMHEPPPEPFFTDELVDGLVKLSVSRRQACLFALETDRDPLEVSGLHWSKVSALRQLSPLAREVTEAAGRTRHLMLPYVFWEWATPTIAAPLLELTWSVENAFGCSWPELVGRYKRMIKVNRGADSASLLELCDGRI